jgi:hypothetical protein
MNSNHFHISILIEDGRTHFDVIDAATKWLIRRFDTLMEAQDYTLRPTCSFFEEHPIGIGGVDGLTGDDGFTTIYCDRAPEYRVLLLDRFDEGFQILTGESPALAGRSMHLLCDGHHALLRDDIASGSFDAEIIEEATVR